MKICDICIYNRHRLTPNTCACMKLGETPMRPMPEKDETAKQVCGLYEAKEEEGDE